MLTLFQCLDNIQTLNQDRHMGRRSRKVAKETETMFTYS